MNTNTETTNIMTTIPTPFTKGSGKKIAAAYTDPANVWVTHFLPTSYGAKMESYAGCPDGKSISVTATVGNNGSFLCATILDTKAGREWNHTLETVSDTVYAANRPAEYFAQHARIAAEAARKQARDERAAVVEAAYAAIKNTDADTDQYERRNLTNIAEQELSFTLDNRYSVVSQMGDAVLIIQKQYEVAFAKRILAVEGRYNEETDRAWTMTEAVTRIIMGAVADSDGTRYETAVPYAKALQRIACRY